jgi:hypothetical protein
MSDKSTPVPTQVELLTPKQSDDTSTADLHAIAEIAKNIVGPLAESQQAVARAQLEAVKVAAETKERLFAKALSAPFIWFLTIIFTGLSTYLLYLGKEAVLLDFAKVAIGGAVGYVAGKNKGAN